MPFIELPGVKGKVFIPEEDASKPKKHNCPDCMNCQYCSDERCEACRKSHCKRREGVIPDDDSCSLFQTTNNPDANNNSEKKE